MQENDWFFERYGSWSDLTEGQKYGRWSHWIESGGAPFSYPAFCDYMDNHALTR